MKHLCLLFIWSFHVDILGHQAMAWANSLQCFYRINENTAFETRY